MANVKVSELPTATNFNDDDYTMIVQNNTTKKIEKSNILENTIYSLGEKIVGKYLGKPLYRKLIDVSFLPNATTNFYLHDISNLDMVIDLKGVFKNGNGERLNLPYVYPNSATTDWWVTFEPVNDYNIPITTGVDRSDYSGYIIIEYTKTTD